MTVRTIDLRDPPRWRDQPAPVRQRQLEIRHLDPWSVARVSILFYLALFGVLLVAGIVLWLAAAVTGVLGNVENFLEDAGFDGFRFLPGQLLVACTVAGLVLVVAGTLANLLLATLYNAVAEIIGGIRITLAEETASKRPPANLTAPLPAVAPPQRGYSSVG